MPPPLGVYTLVVTRGMRPVPVAARPAVLSSAPSLSLSRDVYIRHIRLDHRSLAHEDGFGGSV